MKVDYYILIEDGDAISQGPVTIEDLDLVKEKVAENVGIDVEDIEVNYFDNEINILCDECNFAVMGERDNILAYAED